MAAKRAAFFKKHHDLFAPFLVDKKRKGTKNGKKDVEEPIKALENGHVSPVSLPKVESLHPPTENGPLKMETVPAPMVTDTTPVPTWIVPSTTQAAPTPESALVTTATHPVKMDIDPVKAETEQGTAEVKQQQQLQGETEKKQDAEGKEEKENEKEKEKEKEDLIEQPAVRFPFPLNPACITNLYIVVHYQWHHARVSIEGPQMVSRLA